MAKWISSDESFNICVDIDKVTHFEKPTLNYIRFNFAPNYYIDWYYEDNEEALLAYKNLHESLGMNSTFKDYGKII